MAQISFPFRKFPTGLASTTAGLRSMHRRWMGGATLNTGVTPPTPAVTATTPDGGGHRQRLLQELDRSARQREFEKRFNEPEAPVSDPSAEVTERLQHREVTERLQHRAPQLGRSPLPMVVDFGAGPQMLGLKLPTLTEQLDQMIADDESALIAILLAMD